MNGNAYQPLIAGTLKPGRVISGGGGGAADRSPRRPAHADKMRSGRRRADRNVAGVVDRLLKELSW